MDLVKAVELLEPGPLDQASGKWSGKDGQGLTGLGMVLLLLEKLRG